MMPWWLLPPATLGAWWLGYYLCRFDCRREMERREAAAFERGKATVITPDSAAERAIIELVSAYAEGLRAVGKRIAEGSSRG